MITNAYAAGLIDGEAHVYTRLHKNVLGNFIWRGAIAVAMTDEKAVRALHEKYGGSVFPVKPVEVHHKPQWRWTVASVKAYMVAKAIIKYSIVKHDALQIIIDHYESGMKPKINRPGTKGEGNGSAKLTCTQVQTIRFLAGIKTQQELADTFGVCKDTVYKIQRGAIWLSA